VLAAIAAVLFAYGLWGGWTVITALTDLRLLNAECPGTSCLHHGSVAHRSLEQIGYPGFYLSGFPGTGPSYLCVLTIQFDASTALAGIPESACSQIADGSSVDATVWRGTVVYVTTTAGFMGTYNHPATRLFVGLWRSPALALAVIFVAMIHIDVANHRFWRTFKRRRQNVQM
jgi:hypothetical protein